MSFLQEEIQQQPEVLATLLDRDRRELMVQTSH